MKMKSGLFITIEGGEGSGKSTLIKSIFNWLSKDYTANIVKTFEPGATPLGAKIRKILLMDESIKIDHKAEFFLFLADRAQHVKNVIRPSLKEGSIVLCDRYNDSSIAYQGAARSSDLLEDMQPICQFATDSLDPDITIYLDIDPKIALKRVKGTFDRLEKEKLDFHQGVRKGFMNLAKQHPDRFYTIDAQLDEGEVFLQAKSILAKKVEKVCLS